MHSDSARSTPPPSAAISVRGVGKSFGSGTAAVPAVRDASFEIARGEIVALLGPNGAGKTTLLDLVLGLGSPTSGAIEVCGLPPAEAVRSGKISAVLQTGGLLSDLTVRETVAMISQVQVHTIPVDEALQRAGAAGIANRRVGKCSGGEQQRLRFALALLSNPDVLVLDEPTAAMDVTARREFWSVMQEEASKGRTIVFATHYLEEAQSFAQRIILMASGRVVADGTVHDIQGTIATKTVRFTVPDAASADVASIATRTGAVSHTQVGPVSGSRMRHEVVTADSDALALALFTELRATDVDITPAALDEAFVALTSKTEGVAA